MNAIAWEFLPSENHPALQLNPMGSIQAEIKSKYLNFLSCYLKDQAARYICLDISLDSPSGKLVKHRTSLFP